MDWPRQLRACSGATTSAGSRRWRLASAWPNGCVPSCSPDFPWNAIGYAAMPVPLLMQSVSVTGMIGMNALAVFVFALPGLLAASRDRRIGIALAAILCAAHAGFGYVRLNRPEPAERRTLSVRIVQPSVQMDREIRPVGAGPGVRCHDGTERQGARTGPGLSRNSCCGPKHPCRSCSRNVPRHCPRSVRCWDRTKSCLPARCGRKAAIPGHSTTIRIVAIDQSGQVVDGVDKVHLVPFGEYLPFADIFGRSASSNSSPGRPISRRAPARHAIALPGGIRAVPFICYEIIFPELVAVDAAKADIIVNVTNDAWFGRYAWSLPAFPSGAGSGRRNGATLGACRQYRHFRCHRRTRSRGRRLGVERARHAGCHGFADDTRHDCCRLPARHVGWAILRFLCSPVASPCAPGSNLARIDSRSGVRIAHCFYRISKHPDQRV